MAKGSVGASLDQRLVLSSNYIIPKTKNDAFSNQALDQLLASQKVNLFHFNPYYFQFHATFRVKSPL